MRAVSFLNLRGKTILVFGVANKKSVAYSIARTLEEEGARVVYSVRSDKRRESLAGLLADKAVFTCDVENSEEIGRLVDSVRDEFTPLDGIVHSLAFANYSGGLLPFHETDRADFLQAVQISAFSLVEISNAFKPYLNPNASIVTIGISSTLVTAENYGYMSPIKSALEGCVRNLAKSFSADSEVRFNSVNSGPLKTSASAGIPGYLDNYLYAEKLTFRKRGVLTQEVADTALFLLSERSSGINGQGIVVNAGMDLNYFDRNVVHPATRPPQPKE